MNSKNSETSDPHRALLDLTDKINLKRSDKFIALSNLSMETWKIIKISYKNNKFKISAPKWKEKFELPDGLYSISDIQDYFEYILKTWRKTFNPSVRIYVIESCLKLKQYFLELLTPETMKLLEITKRKITKDGNGENVLYLEFTEVVLVHCNIVNNNYQQNSRALVNF